MEREVRIFQPARTAMQSGLGKTHRWALEFKPYQQQKVDPLMGWPSSGDTRFELHLKFLTCEAAIHHAKNQGYIFTVETPERPFVQSKNYSDNFKGRLR